MTAEKAIKILETESAYTHIDTDYAYDKADGTVKLVPGRDIADALDMAIAALRVKQDRKNPQPLTLEELREMVGEPVWISEIGAGFGYWAIAREVCEYKGVEGLYMATVEDTDDYRAFALYGKKWLAYRHKPKEDDENV